MATRKVEIDADIPLNDQQVTTLLDRAHSVHQAVPLTSIELTLSPPGTYTYELTAADGRTWTQVITVNIPEADPAMTFDVPQGWRRLAEFSHARALRDHIVEMINKAGLTRLQIEWM